MRALAASLDDAAVHRNQAADHGEADPQTPVVTAPPGVDLGVGLEDPESISSRDSDPVVPDHQDQLAPLASRDQRDLAAALGVARGVPEQVDEDLLEATRIRFDDERLGRKVDPQPVPASRDLVLHDLYRRCNGGLQLEALGADAQLSLADPRGVEQVIDQVREAIELPVDDLQGLLLAHRIGRAVAQHRDPVLDRGERVSQLVREHREELVLAPARSRETRIDHGAEP